MAGALGFEPRNGGTKNRCLTTWRRPNEGCSYTFRAGAATEPEMGKAGPKTGLFVGRSRVIRTLDPLLPKQVRYQAALYSENVAIAPGRADGAGYSRGPPGFQLCALAQNRPEAGNANGWRTPS